MKNIATRAAYGEALRDLGADYDFVVMDADCFRQGISRPLH